MGPAHATGPANLGAGPRPRFPLRATAGAALVPPPAANNGGGTGHPGRVGDRS